MEIKKFSADKLKNLATSIGNATASTAAVIGEATKNAAITVAENIKDSTEQFSKNQDLKKFENDKKRLCPVYKEDLLAEDFILPTLINIVEYDKRMENKACEGAVGFLTGKDVKILNIYKEFINLLGVNFYPMMEETVYHIDPCVDKLYIKLDEYFAYLKKMRVDELTTVAQCLGAKHVEIILKSKSSNTSTANMSGKMGIKKNGIDFNSVRTKNEISGVEVAAKIDFGGSDKIIEPKLVYFKNESDINALIKMRLDAENGNKILSKSYSLQYGNSSGIKISDAAKIDTSLASIKCGVSVSNEAMAEYNTILEYNIVF